MKFPCGKGAPKESVDEVRIDDALLGRGEEDEVDAVLGASAADSSVEGRDASELSVTASASPSSETSQLGS